VAHRGRPHPGARVSRGFTIVELAVVVAIVGLLASLAITNYRHYVEKAREVRAIAEIEAISHVLDALVKDDEAELPDSLVGIAAGSHEDPWGTPYQYLRITGPGGGGGAQPRKDRFLVPINTDYDLYSKGPDRESVPPLTAAKSRDDIVRANNGAYIGVAELF
jgi:general secretion pathway protein G